MEGLAGRVAGTNDEPVGEGDTDPSLSAPANYGPRNAPSSGPCLGRNSDQPGRVPGGRFVEIRYGLMNAAFRQSARVVH
jgi:hypothetical protein